jgi:hypothetical protein
MQRLDDGDDDDTDFGLRCCGRKASARCDDEELPLGHFSASGGLTEE